MTPTLSILYSLLGLVAALPPWNNAQTWQQPQHCPPKPAYFVLAGDSTTATQSSGGGGWGDGFLNLTLNCGSSGVNLGVRERG